MRNPNPITKINIFNIFSHEDTNSNGNRETGDTTDGNGHGDRDRETGDGRDIEDSIADGATHIELNGDET